MTTKTVRRRGRTTVSADSGAALRRSRGWPYRRDRSDGDLHGHCPSCGGAPAPCPPHRAASGTTA